MTDDLKKEYTLKISQANSSQLVVILYEMVGEYINEARTNLKGEDEAAFHDSIRKATACIRELVASINNESTVAGNLLSLFIFCQKEMAKADLHCREEELDHVEKIMKKLHDAFETVAKNDNSQPLMGNTQHVYAGLTYGKESLIVNLNSQSNRGFTV